MESARRQLVADGYYTLLLYEDLLPDGAVEVVATALGSAEQVAPGVWRIGLKD